MLAIVTLIICIKLVTQPFRRTPDDEMDFQSMAKTVLDYQIIMIVCSMILWAVWLVTSKNGTDEIAEVSLQPHDPKPKFAILY